MNRSEPLFCWSVMENKDGTYSIFTFERRIDSLKAPKEIDRHEGLDMDQVSVFFERVLWLF